MVVVLIGFGGITGRAQSSDNDEPGAQVLTRGPVHEAFAGIVSYDPEPGVMVSKAPPDLIEEVPPEERPEGDNVAWIPGYWAWDDERDDFLWISGTWRALPPGREWMAGYWGKTSEGHQWISGYWADAAARETTYLPAPPQTVEAGPNISAPSDDYGWTPGCWLWHHGRYAWRPGYWTQGRADWDWIPAHYVWTPRGYIFVEGYWDYSVERRGILFAPVYFESRVYSRRSYHYSPRIVINLSVFNDHLFLRPRYHHYYFGDYYGSHYQQGGIYASFSFQSSRRGYDPFYSRQRWVHREDRAWEHRMAESHRYRRDHEAARPPRTWSAQTRTDARSAESTRNRVEMATPLNQLTKQKDGPVRFQPVAREERSQLGRRGQDVQKSREQRRTTEARSADTSAPRADGALEPAKVKHTRSPIVAKPADQLGRNRPPAQAQQAPMPELNSQPKADTPGRRQNTDRNKPDPQPRQPDAERRSSPERKNKTMPRERQNQPEPDQPKNNPASRVQNAKEREQQSQPGSEPQAQAEATKQAEASPQQHNRERENRNRQESEQREKISALRAREESLRNAREQELKAQQESERRAKVVDAKAADDEQRNRRELEMKVRQENQQRAKVPPAGAQEEFPRNGRGPEQKARREYVRPERIEPGANQPEAARPPRKARGKDENRERPAPEEPPAP